MKKHLSIIILALIPITVVAGALIFGDRAYAWTSLTAAVLCCAAFFASFEGGKHSAERMMMIAMLTALSVAGRILFAPIGGFKPVTAFVVIAAMYFGGEAGFVTGALSALVSNLYFGQGPWTPFQMCSWGLVGLFAGLLATPLKKSRFALSAYGVVSGVIFSLIMDVWTVIWADGGFNLLRYAAVIASSLPFTAIYAVSNVIFLLVLAPGIGKMLERIRKKYGI